MGATVRAARARALLIATAVLLTVPPPALAADITGRVVGVVDGGAIHVLTADLATVRVHLADIDTPEKAQPFGVRAKEVLSGLAYGNETRVAVVDDDRYGRSVGRVYVGDSEVSVEMLRSRMAWVYRKYSRRPELLVVEKEARDAKRGLWADPHPVAPWEWRAEKRKVD